MKEAMKKMMTLLSVIALAFVGTMMIGCSNKEYDIEQPEQSEQPVGSENVITLTTTINLPDTDTKGLDIDYGNKNLSKTFKVGEQVALIYKKTSGTGIGKAICTLTEGDITNGGKKAALTFSVSNPNYGEAVTYIYPAAMAGSTGVDYTRLNTQDGTLASISSGLDLATYSGAWDGENLPTANLANQLAIIAYTLKNADGTSDLPSSITGMSISDGTNNYTINRAAAAGPIYVAIRPTSGATIKYTATVGENYYIKSVTDKTYAAGQFYQLGLRMTMTPVTGHALFLSTIGELVGSDGLAYPATAKNNLPAGVTAEGMVAYKDGKSGLVIARADDGKNTWTGAQTTADGHEPVVADYTWKLPSITDWNKILETYGHSWTGLNAALESAGCTGVVGGENNRYWSSTKTDGTMSSPDWYYYKKMNNGGAAETGFVSSSGVPDNSYYVRACFAFGYNPYVFSVSSGTQVIFSPGNLQLIAANTWQFAAHQWDYFGTSQYDNHRDLFGWGAVNETNSDFNSYTWHEWGEIPELISALGSGWRTLTKDEWLYLLNSRATTTRFCKAKVNSKNGLVLFPDSYSHPAGVTAVSNANNGTAPYNSNSWSGQDWAKMEAAGAVFLPAAGDRSTDGNYVIDIDNGGNYWSSTTEVASPTCAVVMEFLPGIFAPSAGKTRDHGLSVRLVKNK